MSTRSQVLFVEKNEYMENGKKVEWTTEAQIYRHSDGYPTAVLPDLKEFFDWNYGRNCDVSYLAANWIFYEKRKMEEHYDMVKDAYHKKHDYRGAKDNPNDIIKIGYGIEKADHRIHGDENWIYRITVNPKGDGIDERYHQQPVWFVEIARVEGDNTTFDNAKYIASGTLEDVVNRSVEIEQSVY